MGLPKRCKSFLFEPRAYLQDPAVLKMNTAARGAYSTLLFQLWDMPEPGVVEDDDATLSTLSRANGDWDACREAVSRAFDTKTRPGWWIQKRMVQTFEAQNRQISRLKAIGSLGGKSKARNGKASHARAKLKLKASSHTEYLVPRTQNLEPSTRTVFEDFYSNYPRKEKKPRAAAAFKKLLPIEYEALALGLRRWKEHWARGDPQFIPHPASFLNDRQWEDEPTRAGKPDKAKTLMELAKRMKEEELKNGAF